ncbi:MAG: sulfotransferase family 2 domain-containing protein [Parvibaculum sp.]
MNSYLCSFHVPKTGGTTFAHHARTSLEKGQFLQHGPFARSDRFFAGQPQVEELRDKNLARMLVAHGHGADISLAEALRNRTPEFMVILRNPYTRFVSGFHHANSERRNSALPPLTEQSYLGSRGGNIYAKMLLRQFQPLAGPGKGLMMSRVLPILKSFKYLLLTEHMDKQLPELSGLYGLNTGEVEAKRVNPDKTALETDREAFGERNAIDGEIYAALSESAQRPGSSLGNPFGYDPSALEAHLQTVWETRSSAERLERAYDDFIEACRKTGKLQAAYLKLVHGSSGHVSEPDMLRQRLEAALNDWLSMLLPEELSAAHFWSGMMFLNEGSMAVAEDYFREAVRLNPANDNALARLAQTLHARGVSGEARGFMERAMTLRPDRSVNQSIAKIVLG